MDDYEAVDLISFICKLDGEEYRTVILPKKKEDSFLSLYLLKRSLTIIVSVCLLSQLSAWINGF